MEIESFTKAQLYGIIGNSGYYDVNLLPSQIEIGTQIDFANRTYKVISRIELEEERYAVNVISLSYQPIC